MAGMCDAAKQSLHEVVDAVGGELSTAIRAISDRYEPEFDRISDDAPEGGVLAAVDLDIEIKWETVSVALDLPEVTMTTQEWSLDLPQVTMKDKRIVFHTPSVRMVNKKIGQYPEFVGFPPRVRWRDIITKVPEVFMEEHEIIMGIPEVKMDTTSFKLDVPEFAMRTQELKFDVPQITVKSVRAEARVLREEAEAKAAEMRDEIETTRAAIINTGGEKVVAAASALFTCLRTQIQMKRDETAAMFEPGIVMVQQALSKLQEVNAGPEADEMRQRLAGLIAKKAAATANFDEAVRQIVEQEKATVEGLLRGLRGATA